MSSSSWEFRLALVSAKVLHSVLPSIRHSDSKNPQTPPCGCQKSWIQRQLLSLTRVWNICSWSPEYLFLVGNQKMKISSSHYRTKYLGVPVGPGWLAVGDLWVWKTFLGTNVVGVTNHLFSYLIIHATCRQDPSVGVKVKDI